MNSQYVDTSRSWTITTGRWWSVVSVLWLVACGHEGRVDLIVNVKTDLAPGIEFVATRARYFEGTSVQGRQEPQDVVDRMVSASDNWIRGEPVATFTSLRRGNTTVLVSLLDGTGNVVLERPAVVTLRQNYVVTLVMSRDCRGVECPAAGEDPTLTACVGGSCRSPECTGETPEACGELECQVDTECVPGDSCALGRCSDGVCLFEAAQRACLATEWCDPDAGCLVRPNAEISDAAVSDGAADAGDAGLDSSVDAADPDVVDGTVDAALAPAPSVLEIVAGQDHTCARIAPDVIDPMGAVYCWGFSEALASDTVAVAPVRMNTPNVPERMDAGGRHTCGLTTDGRFVCWGSNAQGQLGLGFVSQFEPPTLSAASATFDGTALLASGGGHTCGRSGAGTDVTCWGDNSTGQFGDGTMMSQSSAVSLGLHPEWTRLAAGGGFTCALLEDGTVECWGANGQGELGDGTMVGRSTAAPVSGVTNATAITAGAHHACARVDTGDVLCWGQNSQGQLGDGSRTSRPTAAPVAGLADAVDVISTHHHTCAVRTGGAVSCWGTNANGQIDILDFSDALIPREVPAARGAQQLALGQTHTCVLRSDATVLCWGNHSFGQLGNGLTGGGTFAPGPVLWNR